MLGNPAGGVTCLLYRGSEDAVCMATWLHFVQKQRVLMRPKAVAGRSTVLVLKIFPSDVTLLKHSTLSVCLSLLKASMPHDHTDVMCITANSALHTLMLANTVLAAHPTVIESHLYTGGSA